MAKSLFFRASRRSFDEVTELFDFVWPTAAAMWNLRWQVSGYLQVRADADEDELAGRFLAGSQIHGANLRRACVTWSWERQKMQFAKLILIDVCAMYESWLAEVLGCLGRTAQRDLKGLQFPSQGGRGFGPTMHALLADESDVIRDCLYPGLLRHSKNSNGRAEALLTCYRYFKECRNSLVHNGSLMSSDLETAQGAFERLSATDLGVKQVPEHFPTCPGQKLQISLRGVVGLGDIVMRLITTIDAELAKAKQAESEFVAQWMNVHGRRYTLKSDDNLRERQVSRLVRALELPKPNRVREMVTFLKHRRLVS